MMHVNEGTRRLIHILAGMFNRLPEGQSVTVSTATGFVGGTYQPCVEFQCGTQAAVRRLRACFPGAIWRKEWQEGAQWWTYRATLDIDGSGAVNLYIYACHEAPPTCKAIVEKVTVLRSVPVAFEEREVVEERVRWDCSGAEATEA